MADELAAIVLLLQGRGPQLGRRYVDTLAQSAHANTKEARVRVADEWRFAFAFDEDRNAVILVGADKRGANQKRFYETPTAAADARFNDWSVASKNETRER